MGKQRNGPKKDPYQVVTDRIIAELEQGVVPWRQPWRAVDGTLHRNLITGRPYRGINQMILGVSPYTSPYWLTRNLCVKSGGSVRANELPTPIVFWRFREYEDPETGKTKEMPFLTWWSLFNVEQCDGLTLPEPEPLPPFDPIAKAEAIISDMPKPPTIGWGGDRAVYAWSSDHVQLPRKEAFTCPGEYYSTGFHELTHSTGHESRLDRPASRVCQFGDPDYGHEELIAELGSAMLCTTAGIDNTISSSASYLGGWLDTLRQEPRMLVLAAGKAQKAAKFILGESSSTGDDTAG